MPENIRNTWKGMAAGFAGGLVGAWAMGLLTKVAADKEKQKPKSQQSEDSTVKTASRILRKVTGRELTARGKAIAGPVVHYAMGGVSGAIYGAVSEAVPLARAGFGTLFGTAVWIAADEVAVPAFGLGPSPAE